MRIYRNLFEYRSEHVHVTVEGSIHKLCILWRYAHAQFGLLFEIARCHKIPVLQCTCWYRGFQVGCPISSSHHAFTPTGLRTSHIAANSKCATVYDVHIWRSFSHRVVHLLFAATWLFRRASRCAHARYIELGIRVMNINLSIYRIGQPTWKPL